MPGKQHTPEPMTLEADWLVTMNGPVVRNGRVAVDKGLIVAAGSADDVPLIGRRVRLGQAVLLPGLVNAHCHLELSAYHGALPAGDLWTWLGELVALRLQPDAVERERAAISAAVSSMLAAGTTCVGDVSRAAWLPEALAAKRIRKVCYVELISGALSPPADVAQLRQRLEALPADDPLLYPAVSPHAPYTVTRKDLRDCVELACERHLPLAMHLAETREETEWLRRGTGRITDWHARFFCRPPVSPGLGPAEYAVTAGLGAGFPAALIHMNHADDWEQLCHIPTKHRPTIVYCPRSHRFFGHALHPVRQMLAAGLMVAVGTDSGASHNSHETQPLSVLAEICWLLAEMPDLPPQVLLKMATVHGAAALGLADRIGRIAPGMHADLVGFVLPRSDIQDPVASLLAGEATASLVCIAGELVDCGSARVRDK